MISCQWNDLKILFNSGTEYINIGNVEHIQAYKVLYLFWTVEVSHVLTEVTKFVYISPIVDYGFYHVGFFFHRKLETKCFQKNLNSLFWQQLMTQESPRNFFLWSAPSCLPGPVTAFCSLIYCLRRGEKGVCPSAFFALQTYWMFPISISHLKTKYHIIQL